MTIASGILITLGFGNARTYASLNVVSPKVSWAIFAPTKTRSTHPRAKVVYSVVSRAGP